MSATFHAVMTCNNLACEKLIDFSWQKIGIRLIRDWLLYELSKNGWIVDGADGERTFCSKECQDIYYNRNKSIF